MKTMRYAMGVAIMGAMVLAGCGTEGNHDTVIKDAVSNRTFIYQHPGDGDATLQVVRENGLFGGGCSSQIRIDDKYAVELEIGEQAIFHLPSGQHVVSLENSGPCRKPGDDNHIDTTLAAGDNVLMQVNAHGSSLSLPKRG